MLKILILAVLAVPVLLCRGEDTPMPTMLLTGFEPFGKSDFNTSWEVVRRFDGKEIGGFKIKTLKLKVLYDAVDAPMRETIAELKPAAVISFGEGTQYLQIERVAFNGYHAKLPKDNAKKPPPREKIDPSGPRELPTGLDVAAIVKRFMDDGSAFAVSTNAGGYLCNECMYRLMSIKDAPAVRGFVHVPVIPPADTAGMNPLESQVGALIETVAAQARAKK